MSASAATLAAPPVSSCGPPRLPSSLIRLIGRAKLADGTPVTIRPIRPNDKRIELSFLRGLSRESRYQRLLSGRDLLPGELRKLTEIDYAREMALIATICRDDSGEEEIGVARYILDDTGDSAEFAIVVGDCWQRLGLGEKLLQSLFGAAAEAGVSALHGITLSTNLAMLRLAKKLGFALQYYPGDASLMRLSRRNEGNAA